MTHLFTRAYNLSPPQAIIKKKPMEENVSHCGSRSRPKLDDMLATVTGRNPRITHVAQKKGMLFTFTFNKIHQPVNKINKPPIQIKINLSITGTIQENMIKTGNKRFVKYK